MIDPPLSATDPVAAVIGWLSSHPTVAAGLRGPGGDNSDTRPRIGPRNKPPYPRIRLADTDTDFGIFTGRITLRLTLELLGDPDGRPGKAYLRALGTDIAEALDQMNREAVIGGCTFSAMQVPSMSWAPLPPNNQPRYLLNATTSVRPSTPPA